MTTVFVVQNQHGHYLSKQLEWVEGHDKRILYRTAHRDEAINLVFEQSSKNIELRAHPLECETDTAAQPKVEAASAMINQSDSLLNDSQNVDQNGSEAAPAEPTDATILEAGTENTHT